MVHGKAYFFISMLESSNAPISPSETALIIFQNVCPHIIMNIFIRLKSLLVLQFDFQTFYTPLLNTLYHTKRKNAICPLVTHFFD